MIIKGQDLLQKIQQYQREGLPRGCNPGWKSLEPLYRPQPGYMSIVTGIPQHGKSEVLDGLLVNLAVSYGHKFLLFSPENFPVALHGIKLMEKYIGKPFKGDNGSGMTAADIAEGLQWVDDHFGFLYPSADAVRLQNILAAAVEYKSRYGLSGLVCDPWNELDHDRPPGLSETEYISKCLSAVRRFAREHNVHVWLVAHPVKMVKNENQQYPPPTPYDIAGGAHWRNKADFCLTIHRPDLQRNEVLVLVTKMKFKNFGRIGQCYLDYDSSSGRFKDRDARHYELPKPELFP